MTEIESLEGSLRRSEWRRSAGPIQVRREEDAKVSMYGLFTYFIEFLNLGEVWERFERSVRDGTRHETRRRRAKSWQRSC